MACHFKFSYYKNNLLHDEITKAFRVKPDSNLANIRYKKNSRSRVKNIFFPLETALFSSSIKPARKIRLRPSYENHF